MRIRFCRIVKKSSRNGLLSDVRQQGRADVFTRSQRARGFQFGAIHTGQRSVEHCLNERKSRVSEKGFVWHKKGNRFIKL